MSVTAASNIDSLRAQNKLRITSEKLSKTFERLSSGLRINSAADDSAGLALADSLRADARGAAVAIRNINDGLSATATADAALGEVNNILTRLYELANQSANSIYSTNQRSALSSEFEALGSEVDRVARITEFNDISLLSYGGNITIQAGLDATVDSRITITGVSATLSDLGLGAISGALTYSINGATVDDAVSSARNALTAIDNAITSLSSRRGTIAAAESRLQFAVNTLSIQRENFLAAESRIRDADVASEVAELVRLQVLQQATTSVLAQANQQPATVLRLLG